MENEKQTLLTSYTL